MIECLQIQTRPRHSTRKPGKHKADHYFHMHRLLGISPVINVFLMDNFFPQIYQFIRSNHFTVAPSAIFTSKFVYLCFTLFDLNKAYNEGVS